MKNLCFETSLSNEQVKSKLESILSNDIEFENIIFIKYNKSFILKQKSFKENDLSNIASNSIFDFFKVEVVLNQQESRMSILLILKTFVLSLIISGVFFSLVWGVLALINFPPFAKNLYLGLASLFSIYLLYKIYISNRLQYKIVKRLKEKLETI